MKFPTLTTDLVFFGYLRHALPPSQSRRAFLIANVKALSWKEIYVCAQLLWVTIGLQNAKSTKQFGLDPLKKSQPELTLNVQYGGLKFKTNIDYIIHKLNRT